MNEKRRQRPVSLAPRARPTQTRSELSRRRILEAAHQILKQGGARELTTVAVARASGVSVGALYRFFPNKESIVCALYDEKLQEIRRLGEQSTQPASGAGNWQDHFRHLIGAFKESERAVDFDSSLSDALFTLPQLWAIDLRHGIMVADLLVAQMRRWGSTWSDAALVDLAMNLYALDAANWMYWRYADKFPTLAIARSIEASVFLLEPAMEGHAEPVSVGVERHELLRRLDSGEVGR